MKIVICSLLFFVDSIVGNPELRKEGMIFENFTIGTVLFQNGARINAKLNYDSFEEQMIFSEDGKVMALTNIQSIDRIEISDRTFIWFQHDIFLERIDTAGVTLFKRSRSQIISKGKETSFGGVSQTSSAVTANKLARGYDLQSSDLKMKEEFEFKKDDLFYVKLDKGYKNLGFPKHFSKIYKVDKKLVEEFVKKESIDLLKVNDVVRLMKFCQKAK